VWTQVLRSLSAAPARSGNGSGEVCGTRLAILMSASTSLSGVLNQKAWSLLSKWQQELYVSKLATARARGPKRVRKTDVPCGLCGCTFFAWKDHGPVSEVCSTIGHAVTRVQPGFVQTVWIGTQSKTRKLPARRPSFKPEYGSVAVTYVTNVFLQ
jgi:hypothetical protein